LTTEVGGIVREILFEPGTEVSEGTVLLRLDTEADQAQLVSLQAAARLADRELRRARQLQQERNISEAEVQRRESEAEQAQAAVAAQQARIQQKSLRAPFDGKLGIRRVNLGQFISPGDPIVTLESVDPIFVNFSLTERRLGTDSDGAAGRGRCRRLCGTLRG
jgi:membrane fusion protein, multidrug efflux system